MNVFPCQSWKPSMAGMSWFAKIDLSNAYFQIALDEDSRNIATITTPVALLRYKRLPVGLKSSSFIFQKSNGARL